MDGLQARSWLGCIAKCCLYYAFRCSRSGSAALKAIERESYADIGSVWRLPRVVPARVASRRMRESYHPIDSSSTPVRSALRKVALAEIKNEEGEGDEVFNIYAHFRGIDRIFAWIGPRANGTG